MEIQITHNAYSKFRHFINECDTEVSGLGKVREVITEDKKFLEIYDVEVLPQEVGTAHSSIDPETLAQFLFKKMKAKEKIEDYKVWWHSHVDFEAYFSSTDIGTIEGSTDFPYLISIVGNKKGDIEARIDICKPIHLHEKVNLNIQLNQKLLPQVLRDIKKNLTFLVPRNFGSGSFNEFPELKEHLSGIDPEEERALAGYDEDPSEFLEKGQTYGD